MCNFRFTSANIFHQPGLQKSHKLTEMILTEWLKVFLGLQHSETGVENVHNCSAAWEIETEREFDLKESERLNQGNLGIEKNIPNIYVIQT